MNFNHYFSAYTRYLSLLNLENTRSYTSRTSLLDSLNNVRALLGLLGNPEQHLKFVHVTGTSGKGSVTRLMHEILLQAGYAVGSYSSPHTTSYLERYRINHQLVNPDTLADAMEMVMAAYEKYLRANNTELSYFALNTCIALLLFKQAKLTWCVLEVGMGGRFDSTNVIPSPEVAIITNIDLDHTQFLGPTKMQIAYEKAGIIKPGCVVITGETEVGPLKIIRKEANRHTVPLVIIPNHSRNHIQHNADLCQAAGLILGISTKVIEQTIKHIKPLPCRLEIIQDKPRVIIDGAHNSAKIKATVATIQRQSKGKVILIFGCKQSKDAAGMARALAKIANTVITTRSTDTIKKSANPVKLLKLFPSKLQGNAFLFPRDALNAALNVAKKSDTILITGSLYLAGELRTHWRTEEQILRDQES